MVLCSGITLSNGVFGCHPKARQSDADAVGSSPRLHLLRDKTEQWYLVLSSRSLLRDPLQHPLCSGLSLSNYVCERISRRTSKRQLGDSVLRYIPEQWCLWLSSQSPLWDPLQGYIFSGISLSNCVCERISRRIPHSSGQALEMTIGWSCAQA